MINSMNMNHNMNNDEVLLSKFFAEHHEPIADNGFTERVLAALPERENACLAETMRLRRWSLWLNVFGIVAGLGLLIYLGVFGMAWDGLMTFFNRIYVGVITFDFESLLVDLMLFLHRLPELLPSTSQLLVISATTLLLSYEVVKKLYITAQNENWFA